MSRGVRLLYRGGRSFKTCPEARIASDLGVANAAMRRGALGSGGFAPGLQLNYRGLRAAPAASLTRTAPPRAPPQEKREYALPGGARRQCRLLPPDVRSAAHSGYRSEPQASPRGALGRRVG